MSKDLAKEYYEKDSSRFWDPRVGFADRDKVIYPLLNGLKGNVLEYGCGSGSLLLNLAIENRFKNIIGIDISENALSRIKDIWSDMSSEDKVSLFTPISDTIPYIDENSQDLIISVATIEHVFNPYVVLDELYRVAKPNAFFVCSVPNYAYLKHRIALLFGNQPKTGTDKPVTEWRKDGWDGMHLHTFTKSSFSILLNDCGWKTIKWLGSGKKYNSIGFGYLRKRYPGLFSGELIALCVKRG